MWVKNRQILNSGQNPNYLNSLFEAREQKREEDSGDGYVVSWLSKTCVFSTGVHRHAPWNVTDWHLVTLWDNRRKKKSENQNGTITFIARVSGHFSWI